ncbi:MAG: hypothetical protein AAB581_04030 [Patescibacteria group bacterium]
MKKSGSIHMTAATLGNTLYKKRYVIVSAVLSACWISAVAFAVISLVHTATTAFSVDDQAAQRTITMFDFSHNNIMEKRFGPLDEL